MAIRIFVTLLLATVGLIAYAAALLATPFAQDWLGAVAAPPGARHFPRASFGRELALAVAFQLSLFVIYAALPGRLARMIGGGARQAIVNAALVATSAMVLWLAVLYAADGLTTVQRSFAAILAGCTGALLVCPWFLRARGPAEALGLMLALTLVCGATPAGPNYTLVITSYTLAILLGYGLIFARFGTSASLSGRIVTLFVGAAAAHLLWIGGLFYAGVVAALPVWLAFASVILILAFGIALPVGLQHFGEEGALYGLLYSTNGQPDVKLLPELVQPVAPSGNSGKRAWIISYTGVSNEPRVLRQCEALLSEGWQVVVCGFDGHSPRPSQWTFVRLPSSDPFGGEIHRTLAAVRKLAEFLLARCGIEGAAHVVHAATPLWLHTRLQLKRLAKNHPELKADLVISHDWHSADVGHDIAAIYDAKFSIDVHEYAAGQYSYDPEWVRLHKPVTVAVQRHYLRRADVVTVVCQGIGELIAEENGLVRQPIVIRSVPFKAIQPFRPTGARIEVLYHGDLSQRREIHTAIASIPLWRPEFYLRLRGSGDALYLDRLKAQVAELDIADRVVFEPPVPFDQIIPAANQADIGFFSFDGTSPQIRFTLPNKLFEYIMAGLCLCVGDTPEVNRIVSHYKNGRLIAPHSAEAIAAAINSLDRETIDAFKRASITTGEQLNWEAERAQLLQAYREAMR